MSRWHRYWFGPGWQLSAAVLRIAVAISILWMLSRIGDGYLREPTHAPHDMYRATGINRLYGIEPPPWLLSIAWYAAWASTLAMLVGIRTRLATAISFVTAVALASYEASFGASWSHDNNAPLLAQLVLLGARTGDTLSIDAWLRRRKGVALAPSPYRHPVLLAQLAIGLMMASAAISKLASGKLSLDWALSDNLRNQILLRFDFRNLPREPIADWIVDDPLRWKATALLNIGAQLVPLVAMFVVRHPRLRLLCGLVFVAEVFGLAFVMGFYNFHWLPLAAAFVDWEWLVGRVKKADRDPPPEPVVGRAPKLFVIAFLVVDVGVAFWRWPKLDQKLNLYPLSSFPMFASIRAQPPYDEHKIYELFGARLELVSEPPPRDDQLGWLHHRMMGSTLYRAKRPEDVQRHLTEFARRIREAFPETKLITLRAVLTSTQMPAYPAPAGIARVDVATLGELDADGTFRTHLTPTPAGPDLLVYRDGIATPLVGPPPPGRQRDRRYLLDRVGDRTFVVAPW